MADTNYRIAAGISAILLYLIHAGVLIYSNEPYHMLWSCHLGCMLVGVGLLIPQPWLLSIGFLWLAMGVPLWMLNVLTSNEFMWTSTLSHIGGLALAVYGFRFLKMPPFSWAVSTTGLIVLGFFSRFVTPQHANVNLIPGVLVVKAPVDIGGVGHGKAHAAVAAEAQRLRREQGPGIHRVGVLSFKELE